MPGFKKKQPTRNLTRLFRMIGVQFPEDMPKLERSENVELNSFTQSELRYMPGMTANAKDIRTMDTAGLTSYLSKVATNNADWIRQSDAIRVLTPEIERASEIMVSSIISPTDMQTDTVNVVCSDTDLGEEIESKAGDILSTFFNDTVELGDLVYKYTKEALYGSGAAAILILPPKNLDILNTAVDIDQAKAGLIKLSGRKHRQKITADNPTLSVSNEAFASTESLLPEATTENKASLEFIEAQIEHDLAESLERWNPFIGIKNKEVITRSKEAREQILNLFRSSNKHIVMSSDLDGVRRGKNKLNRAVDRMAKSIEKNFLFEGQTNTYVVDDTNDLDNQQSPSIIEIPSSCVVPVAVPGSPDKHIGYFILVDQWGNPMVDMEQPADQAAYGPRRLTESATQAAFGAPTLYRFSSSMTDQQRYDITSTIFGITLKHLMEHKLEEFGMAGTTIEEHDAIAGCMFRNLLHQKKCVLVFVPEPLMIYYRFQHRPDGTGKSITEPMCTLLSLRTVLLMSYIMAATENSIDNKIISVNVDEKQTNIQQYLDMVRNAYVSKKMMRFDINPLTVQQDLIQKSLTILPKGIKGISDSLDVQTEHRSTGSIAPDNDLLDKISNWIITGLEVPYSALNQLAENEYSRSVASTNLFFSNNVKNKQKTVIKHMSKFVKLYTRYSPILREKLYEMLKSTAVTAKDNKSTEASSVPVSKHEVKTNDNGIRANLHKLIGSVKITLPTPRIVVDKSQYEEIDKYLGAVEKIISTVYNDDMIPEDAQDLTGTYKAIKASILSNMARDYIDNIGFQSSYELPYPEDVNIRNIKSLVQLLANQRKGFKDWMNQIVNKASSDDLPTPENPNPESSDNGGEPSSSGSDDFGQNNEETPNEEGGKNEEGSEPNENPEETNFDEVTPPPTF